MATVGALLRNVQDSKEADADESSVSALLRRVSENHAPYEPLRRGTALAKSHARYMRSFAKAPKADCSTRVRRLLDEMNVEYVVGSRGGR